MSIHISIQKIPYKFIANKNNALPIKCESGLRHHKNIKRRQQTSFFVSETQCLQGSSRILTLPTYTQLNRHQVNDVGTFAGICRFDKVLYPQFGCEDS